MKNKQPEKKCVSCWTAFAARSDRQRYCSKRCRPSAYKGQPLPESTICTGCDKSFKPRTLYHKFCSAECWNTVAGTVDPESRCRSSSLTGSLSELAVSLKLLLMGYYVFRAIAPTGPFDLVAVKGGERKFIEVRTGTRRISGEPSFSRNIHHEACPPTDFAVYIPETKEVFFFPVVQPVPNPPYKPEV